MRRKSAAQRAEDFLYRDVPPGLQKLRKQARKERRLDARAEWKNEQQQKAVQR